LIEVPPEPAAFMSEHKYKIGQWISYGPPGQRRIVYIILQKLPAAANPGTGSRPQMSLTNAS
jgi:hypothetical protein